MFKKKIVQLINGLPGWHTPRRIVVIESDDWGSIRMPDKATYDLLLAKGIRVDNCPYNRYDSLASEKDLSALFELLAMFRDFNGNHPVLTANCVVANPDFERIRDSGFTTYQYEKFTDTLLRFPDCHNSFHLWKEGMTRKLFHPEFHGREHLNVIRWMDALGAGMPETMLAFNHGLFGISTHITSERRKSYLQVFDVHDARDLDQIRTIIADGIALFRQIFGYPARSFIAPNYTWPVEIEPDLAELGIRYLKGGIIQNAPVTGTVKNRKIRHFTGRRNHQGQIHIERNCGFEPTLYPNRNSVDDCLHQISQAFEMNKPAVITSHRVNFIGSLVESNRDNNLRQLRMLFIRLLQKWPEVEFMTAEELGDLIDKNRKTGNDE